MLNHFLPAGFQDNFLLHHSLDCCTHCLLADASHLPPIFSDSWHHACYPLVMLLSLTLIFHLPVLFCNIVSCFTSICLNHDFPLAVPSLQSLLSSMLAFHNPTPSQPLCRSVRSFQPVSFNSTLLPDRYTRLSSSFLESLPWPPS